jgi:opacity protein-like surface antigen
MNINKWTVALAAAGVVSLASVANAQDAKETVKTLAASTTLSGYVSTSVNWTPSKAPGAQGYFANSGKTDRIALDVISLTVASKAGEGEWAAGYKAQIWAGPDAAALGTADAGADFAIKNAYISLRAPLGTGVDLKLGVFDTIIGYESTDRNVNPFYSHSYGFAIEPTQHTGLLASYRVSDAISLSAGIANTTDAVINGASTNTKRKTYMAAGTLTAPASFGFLKGTSVTVGWVGGRASAGATTTDSLYVGGTIPLPIKDLSLGLAWDEELKDRSADRSVLAAYLSYKVSDKLTANARYEYVDAGAGTVGDLTASHDLHGITVGLDYKLWANVTSRLEYRLDIGDDGSRTAAKINGLKKNNSVIANVIYNF